MNDTKAGTHKFSIELEDIHYKYERLQSMIGILQMFIAEIAEVTNVPEDSVANALYEIELGMGENNERLKKLYRRNGGLE